MSHHEEHSGDAGHAHPPPGIPEVRDEAGDTPPWVPKLGIALGAALAALIIFMVMQAQQSAPAEAPAADEKTEAAAE